jgi:hypothetical protein
MILTAHQVCYPGDKPRLIRWVLHVSCIGVRTDAYRGLVGKSEGKRPLGIRRRMYENNI